MTEQQITGEIQLRNVVKGKRIMLAVQVAEGLPTAWCPTTREGAESLLNTVTYHGRGQKILVASEAWDGAVVLNVRNPDYFGEAD